MGVKERKAIEKQVRKNQILTAARTLLFSLGMDNISMSKIAKNAELGISTIYFYFKNKEAIFVALQEEGVTLLYSTILEIVNQKTDPEEKLISIASVYYNFSKEHENYFDIINYFLSSSRIFFETDLKKKIDMSGSKLFMIVKEIVNDGIKQKFFKNEDSEKFAIMFWGTLHGLIQFKKLERTALENKSHKKIYDYSVKKLILCIK